jgi:hypothetical protein
MACVHFQCPPLTIRKTPEVQRFTLRNQKEIESRRSHTDLLGNIGCSIFLDGLDGLKIGFSEQCHQPARS